MKIRLKTLFAITVLVAIIAGGVATVLRTKSELKRLGVVVEESLDQIKELKAADIRKSSLSNDFVLMSWGNMKWNVELPDKTQAEVEHRLGCLLLWLSTADYCSKAWQHAIPARFCREV